jgi:hypothetical protein
MAGVVACDTGAHGLRRHCGGSTNRSSVVERIKDVEVGGEERGPWTRHQARRRNTRSGLLADGQRGGCREHGVKLHSHLAARADWPTQRNFVNQRSTINDFVLQTLAHTTTTTTISTAHHGPLAGARQPVAGRAVVSALNPRADAAHPPRPHQGPQGLPVHARRV